MTITEPKHRGRPQSGALTFDESTRSSLAGLRAFTLIELLTVIAIIGILASILIPVVGEVREQAKRASCQSGMRQQVMAMLLFAEDNYGKPPREGAPAGSTPAFWNVLAASTDNAPIDLYPAYTDDETVFACASTKNRIRTDFKDKQGRLRDLYNNALDREDDRGGHSYEYLGVYGTKEMRDIMKTPASVLDRETFTVLVMDGDDAGLQNCPDPINNHGEAGWNWGFADGHVEWVSRERSNEVSDRSYHSASRCP